MQHVEGQSLKTQQEAMTSATQVGKIQQNFSTAPNNQVVLFLFSPKYVPNFARRPLQYRFSDQFVGDLMDAALQESVGARQPGASFMKDYSSSSSAVLPRTTANEVDLRQFSQYWTFVLIVDNKQLETCFNTRSAVASRLIYTGWVMGEPAGHGHTGNVVINNNAILNITSFVKLAQNSNCFGPAGASTVVTTNDNRLLADPVLLQRTETDGQTLYNLSPIHLANSVQNYDGHNYNVSTILHQTPMAATFNNSELTVPISSCLGNPYYHISHLVEGLAGAIASERLNRDEDSIYAWNRVDSGNILHAASSAWRDPALVAFEAPDPQKAHTIGELDLKYPYMNVQVMWQPHDPTHELSDPMAPTRRNVFTSVVASSLPYLLNELGIIDVSFRYDSFDPNSALASTENQGIWVLTNIALSYSSDIGAVNAAWMKLLERMKWSIFRILKDNNGDFTLNVHCSPMGSTLVDLHFLDDRDHDHGFTDINGALGGINAVTVGTQADATANASQLSSIGQQLDVRLDSESNDAYANFHYPVPISVPQPVTPQTVQPQTGGFAGIYTPDKSSVF